MQKEIFYNRLIEINRQLVLSKGLSGYTIKQYRIVGLNELKGLLDDRFNLKMTNKETEYHTRVRHSKDFLYISLFKLNLN